MATRCDTVILNRDDIAKVRSGKRSGRTVAGNARSFAIEATAVEIARLYAFLGWDLTEEALQNAVADIAPSPGIERWRSLAPDRLGDHADSILGFDEAEWHRHVSSGLASGLPAP